MLNLRPYEDIIKDEQLKAFDSLSTAQAEVRLSSRVVAHLERTQEEINGDAYDIHINIVVDEGCVWDDWYKEASVIDIIRGAIDGSAFQSECYADHTLASHLDSLNLWD